VKSPAVVSLAWSPLLCAAISLAHIVPLASVFVEGVPDWVRWSVIILCMLSAVRAWHIAARLRKSVLRPHAEGALLEWHSGEMLEGRVLSSSVDRGVLIVLHWRAEGSGQLQRFALLRDAFSAEDWRVLKIWLRWSIMKQAA